MKKFIFILVLFIISNKAISQEGIKFEKGNWEETKALAIKENKLIFVDFYTQWCGPCYNMAKNVFTLYSVGSFYNSNFVNAKIDAENGEGITLAKKFGVRSYPTYCFINPKTEEVVHRAGSNIPADVFIFVGNSALDPSKTSVYLENKRNSGEKSGEFLLDYANYCGSVYKRDEVKRVADELASLPGYGLDNPAVWTLFTKFVNGRDNGLFIMLCKESDKYKSLYGTDVVDAKLFAECSYVPNASEWDTFPNFNGKDFLMSKAKADLALREKDYHQAAKLYDVLMANPGDFGGELCRSLVFTARSNMYGDHPNFWHDKCLEIARYVAYNHPNRDDATIHNLYAQQLELKLERINQALSTPSFGTLEYSMRPADLKKKPKR